MEAARQTPPGARPNRNDVAAKASGPSGPVIRVGCLTRRATGVPEEWPSRLRFAPQAIQNPAYRPADTSNGGSAQKTAEPPPIFAASEKPVRRKSRSLRTSSIRQEARRFRQSASRGRALATSSGCAACGLAALPHWAADMRRGETNVRQSCPRESGGKVRCRGLGVQQMTETRESCDDSDAGLLAGDDDRTFNDRRAHNSRQFLTHLGLLG